LLTEPHPTQVRAVRADDRPDEDRRPTGRRWPCWAQPLVTVLASTGLFVLGFGGGTWRMSVPLGGGDFLPAYATARLWSQGSPFGDTSLGFPFGIEQRYYPTADVLQNLAAGLVAWVSGNPFLGINTVYAASFPLTALAALWVFRTAGLRSWWTVVGSLGLTFIPFHWYRLEHVYLATMYSAVLGVGLAVLIGTGTVERRLRAPAGRRGFLLMGLLVTVAIGASGIYYACFTLLLCAAACLYRLTQGARWRGLVLAAAPAVGVGVVLAVVLIPSVLYVRANPPIVPIADRMPIESVLYAGSLALALLPAPVSRLPLVNRLGDNAVADPASYPLGESQGLGNYGSVATVIAAAILVVGAVLLVRRSAQRREAGEPEVSPHEDGSRVGLGFIELLMATSLLFFVPWGLNYVLALFVSSDIRGWNRLLPVLFTLVFLGAGVVVHRWGARLRPAVTAVLLAVALVVLVADSILPFRSFFAAAAAQGSSFSSAGYEYAADLNAAVPGHCGVLELPYFPYPEVPPRPAMGNYEPLWPAVTNPEKSWSGAAMKGTLASAWQASLGDDVDARDIPDLVAGGFCAVHVDQRGYSAEDAAKLTAQLTGLLGGPVATGLGGKWDAYALPSPTGEVTDAVALPNAPDGVGAFYAPPQITPGPGAPPTPSWTPFETSWWLPEGTAKLHVDSLDSGPAFDSIAGQLRAGSCGDRDVVVSVWSAGGEIAEPVNVHLQAAQDKAFSIQLDGLVRHAELRVESSAAQCAADAGPGPGAVALVDPQALN
jgi:phosphoglycerol transferase